MNLLHLKYVVEVAKTHSITKAAQNLFMGQPNLSKSIKDLEKDIGITIFKRTAKGVEPTPQGASFLSYAQVILTQIDELESLYKKADPNSLSFNISVPRATYISVSFADFANEFVSKDQISLQIKETDPVNAIKDVVNGVSSLAVVRFQNIFEPYFLNLLQENELKYEPLWEFKMQVMMHKNHPLAHLSSIPYHMLNSYIEVIHGDYKIPSTDVNSMRKEDNLNLATKQVTVYDRGSQYDMLRRLRGSYMWVSPVPEDVLDYSDFVTRPTTPTSVISKDIIVYPKEDVLDKIEQKFIETLKKQVEILKTN